MQTKVEAPNQAMRDRDKVKDDAIAHLSDQLIALTARFDRKTTYQLIDAVRNEPIDIKEKSTQ